MDAATLTGLYFVGIGNGPVGGVVAGMANRETLIVREMSDGERVVYVPVALAIHWDFYHHERDAIAAFARVCREVWHFAPTNKPQ